METTIKSTQYALLSVSDYLKLNEQISKALGYDLSLSTARYSDVSPKLAKVNITETSFETKAVLMITTEVQELIPNILDELELVNHWDIQYAEPVDTLHADGLTSNVVDYTLNHAAVVGVPEVIIDLEHSPRTIASDEAVEILVSQGKTVITVSNE